MTLKEAVRTFLLAGLYTGPVFLERFHDDVDDGIVLLDLGQHKEFASRYKRFPALGLTLRAPSTARESSEAKIRELHAAFDLQGPLLLASGYRAGHSACADLPGLAGPDSSGRWLRTLTINFSLSRNQSI